MKNKLYLAAIVVVAVAFGVLLTSPLIMQLISFPPGRATAPGMFYATVLAPISGPASPVPTTLGAFLSGLIGIALGIGLGIALLLVQAALLGRRIWICVIARQIVAPPSYGTLGMILLAVGIPAWAIGSIGMLLPSLIQSLLPKEALFGVAVVQAFIIPYVWIVANNVLGPTFFVVELLSIGKEGLRPLPNHGVHADAHGSTARR